jgi:hypothetical protein
MLFSVQGKLQDGYKIIVFTAPITAGDSLQCGGTVKLHGNSVRLAHAGAPLGFVNPRHLSRGLSLKSILPGMSYICLSSFVMLMMYLDYF